MGAVQTFVALCRHAIQSMGLNFARPARQLRSFPTYKVGNDI